MAEAAVDRSIWREFGDPLVAGAADGPLRGRTVAVKDLFAVAGFAIGAGNPLFLAEAPVQAAHAPAVAALLAAGADLRGIAQTDEFAYSIAGANPHAGTPPNGAAPGRLPGGSTSGPASAVALGATDIGLGTDTAGSIRVPASYQGLWGLRSTHGAVPLDGVWPLAPSFDTVGWLARDAATLRAAAATMLTSATPRPGRLVLDPALVAGTDPVVRLAFDAAVAEFDAQPVDLGDPAPVLEAFRVVQAAEAWRSDGEWLTRHPGALGPGTRERFAIAAEVTPVQEAAARDALAVHSARLEEALGDAVLLLPSAASAAPPVDAGAAVIDAVRAATLRLTVVAGATGRPALSVPSLRVPEPVGLCLVGPRGSDLALIDLALDLVSGLALDSARDIRP